MQPVEDPAGWLGSEMRDSAAWIYPLSTGEVAEIDAAVATVQGRGLDFKDVKRQDFELPTLGPRLAELRHELLYGRGFALLRGMNPDPDRKWRTAMAFWGLGMHLGDSVASQNAKGHTLGHIQDIGQSRDNVLQRGPYSREAIPYHCDACDIVGLYCLHPARTGGESTIASSVSVYNELLRRRPDLAKALLAPIYRDRRGEVPEGMQQWYAIPIFNFLNGWFSANIEPTYIGSVERFEAVPKKTVLQKEAIDTIQSIAADLHLSMGFRQGDMQFINNYVIFHSRTGYEEFPERERKRHLLRLWLKCDDGRPLPHWFYERHGPAGTVDRPGGIVGPDTVLNTPLDAN